MYPGDSSDFMEKFKKGTSKPYGKLILDLRPNIMEKDRFITGDDDDNQDKVHQKSITTNKVPSTMTQMYSTRISIQVKDRSALYKVVIVVTMCGVCHSIRRFCLCI